MRLRTGSVAVVVRTTAVVLAAWPLAAARSLAVTPASAAACTIDLVAVVAASTMPDSAGGGPLGGLSDLAVMEQRDRDHVTVVAITDRGPNGTADVGGVTRRTLLEPAFVPSLVCVELDLSARGAEVAPAQVMPLVGLSGTPANGRPNGVGADEPMLEADGRSPLAASPDGVDTEGLVPCDDGFWACEEYRPSLLRIGRDGRIRERHVPRGARLAAADTRVLDDLPAAYADRWDNRGFEALAISPDRRRLFALLQSPLDHPAAGAARDTGNVRLLVCDAATGGPVAEHVYRLGDPEDAGYGRTGCPPDDGKLCAMAAIGDGVLLVLEQGDGGVARLYRVELAAATDTLGRGAPVEPVHDLAAAGVAPVGKRLVADLGPHLRPMRRDVLGGDGAGAIKLEGLAVIDGDRLLLVNDDDFGVRKGAEGPRPRTCLWLVTLGEPLEHRTVLTTARDIGPEIGR